MAISKPTGTLAVALTDLKRETWWPSEEGNMIPMASTYEFLTYRDTNGKTIPGLAERWEVSPDGRAYTFHLRKGIQFHDGWGELTADDVKFSYEIGSVKGTANATGARFAQEMDKVEVVDRYAVVFRLKQFSVFFFNRIGREATPGFPILSKKYVDSVGKEKAATRPIGTGPYKMVEHVFGDRITFEAVENHWRKTPAFRTLVLRKIPEEATRVNMLRAGEVDVIDVAGDFIAEVTKGGFQLRTSSGSSGYLICLGGQYYAKGVFDPNYPWVGDPKDPKVWERALKVRKALALAVDRDEITKALLPGTGGTLVAPYLVNPGIPGALPGTKPYPYDPQEARRLLAEAGYPQGFDINLKLWPMVGREEGPKIGQAVANMWERVGVRVKLEIIDSQLASSIMRKKSAEAYAWIYAPMLYDEPVMGYSVLANSANDNAYAGYDTPDLDKLIKLTDSEADDERRAALHRQMSQLVYDNYLTLPIATKGSTWAVNNRVGDWATVPSMIYPTNFESITHGPGFKP